jgi:hypothetical protein
MSAEGREGPTPPKPNESEWQVECLDSDCGSMYSERAPYKPCKCGTCGGYMVISSLVENAVVEASSDELQYRGRGKPRLPKEQKRTEKVVVALTALELQRYVIASAKAGFRRIQDWARAVLEKAASDSEK